MHEIHAARRATRGARVRREEEREEQRLPRASPEVPDDPVPVREPEVPERRGRDDVDLDPRLAQVLDRVAHEDPGDVVRARGYDVVRTRTFIRAARRASDHGQRAASVAKT